MREDGLRCWSCDADNCDRNHYLNSKAGIAEFGDSEE